MGSKRKRAPLQGVRQKNEREPTLSALGFLFGGDEVVIDWLAAGEEVDLGIRRVRGKDGLRGLGIGFGDVTAVEKC